MTQVTEMALAAEVTELAPVSEATEVAKVDAVEKVHYQRQLRFHTLSGNIVIWPIGKKDDHTVAVWPHGAYLCCVEDVYKAPMVTEINQVGDIVVLGTELDVNNAKAFETPIYYDPHNHWQKPVLCYDGIIRGFTKSAIVLPFSEVKYQMTA